MTSATSIGMVSQSLRNLLLGEMTLTPEVEVTIQSPFENGNDRRINLFLYKVQESPTLRNMDWQVKSDDTSRLVPPPLSLNLFYLMTPYALNDPETGNSTAHEILGEAMRVFYEHPIIPADYLPAELSAAREQIKIIHNDIDMEELGHVWNATTKPYQLSAAYEVSVVQLDMLSASERAMARRVREVGVPTVSAPYKPPEVMTIEPISGPAGSTVTCRGKNLSGWKAYASIMNRAILDGEDLTSDTFDLVIPADLTAGFYEIRLDISHLFRKTSFFEVTS